jgi:hypothetical protein
VRRFCASSFDAAADPRIVLLGEDVVDAAAATWIVEPTPPPGGEQPFVQSMPGVTERCVVTLTFTSAETVE